MKESWKKEKKEGWKEGVRKEIVIVFLFFIYKWFYRFIFRI